MSFKLSSKDLYETKNYCNILNITKSILGIASKIRYNYFDCMNQNKYETCNYINDLFERSSIIPVPHYAPIVNVLEKSVMSVLECDKVKLIHYQNNTLLNYELILFFIIISYIIYFFVIKYRKNK